MATSQGFNKPKVDYIKVNRKKKQEKKKAQGVAQKGKQAKLAVSAVRTKKHARKVEHRQRMQDKAAKLEEQAAAAQAAAAEANAADADVEMSKVRVKKPKVKAPKAMQL